MDIFSLLSASGNARSGAIPGEALGELKKALEAGFGSDSEQFTQGAALRIESLEKTMLSTIQENQHFRLMNRLQKANATATVDEWTEQNGVGGHRGGSTNSETGVIREATGSYRRRVEQVKFLMTRRQISVVLNVNLAVMNLLPFPVLDGGHILLALIEWLCGHPIHQKTLEIVQTTFAMLLIGTMLYISFFDVSDLVVGRKTALSPAGKAADTMIFAPATGNAPAKP